MISDKRLAELKDCEFFNGIDYVTPTKEYFDNPEIFRNVLVRFYDRIEKKWGWLNSEGVQFGSLHEWVDNFNNNFATFRDVINDKNEFGYADCLGFEFKSNLFNFGSETTYVEDFEKNKPILLKIEKQLEKILFQNFPDGTLKRFILRKFMIDKYIFKEFYEIRIKS